MKPDEAISVPRRPRRPAMPVAHARDRSSSLALRRSPLLLLAAALMALAASLGPGARPASAEDSSVLVSNIGQERRTAFGGFTTNGWVNLTGFVTGNSAVTLESIETVIRNSVSEQGRAAIRAVLYHSNTATTSLKPSHWKLVELTVPATVSAGRVTFTAPEGTTLEANTKYYFALYTTTGLNIWPDATDSDAEDSGAAAGWSIDDTTYYTNANTPGGRWVKNTNNSTPVFRIQVKGVPIADADDEQVGGL